MTCPILLKKNLLVPAKGSFIALNAKVVNDNDQYILVNFSNPIEQNQTLEGLVSCDGLNELKYIINNNQVLIYPSEIKAGVYTLKNIGGRKRC